MKQYTKKTVAGVCAAWLGCRSDRGRAGKDTGQLYKSRFQPWCLWAEWRVDLG